MEEPDDPGAEPTRSPRPSRRRNRAPSRPRNPASTPGTQAQIRDLLDQAEPKFTAADEALRNGDSVRWARLMEQGRRLIEEAVEISAG